MAEEYLNRREFVRRASRAAMAGSLWALAAGGCGGGDDDSGKPTGPSPADSGTLTLELSDARYAPLKEVGRAVKVNLSNGRLPLIVVRIDQSTFVAYSSRCTHQGCEVPLPGSNGISQCPCHGSRFDNQGRVVRGPATRDLARAEVRLEGEVLIIQV